MNLKNLTAISCALLLHYAGAECDAAPWSTVKALNPNAAIDSRVDERPAISADGTGKWVSVWGSSPPPAWDYEAYSANSSDNGATWTGPITVNSDATSASEGHDITVDVANDRNGTWVAAWMKNAVISGGDWDIYFSQSTNNGTSWSQRTLIDSDATSDTLYDQYPSLATDGKGTFVAIWGSIDIVAKKFYMKSSRSTDNGATWQKASLVYPWEIYNNSEINTHFRLDTDGNGVWMAIAHANNPTSATTGTDMDIIAFRSTDAGATWSSPIVMNSEATSDTEGQAYPHIAADSNGTWVAAWSQVVDNNMSLRYARSTDGGLSWTDSSVITAASVANDTEPFVATDRHGSWIIAWEDRTSASDWDLEYAESHDHGATWVDGGKLNSNHLTDTRNDGQINIESDQQGQWIAVWTSGNAVSGGGPDQEINYAISEFRNPQASISSSTLDFGSTPIDGGATGTLDLVITNSGLDILTFGSGGIYITGPSAGSFAFLGVPSLQPLEPGESRTVTISFDPVNLGAHLALLRVYTNAHSSPEFIELHGSGEAAASRVDAWSLY